MKTVKKLDGRRQKYKREKLISSILKAFESVDELDDYAIEKANNIADFIEKEKEKETAVPVSAIGLLVEKGLMSCKKKDVARQYILYRDERTRMRGNTTDKVIQDIIADKSDYWSTENSNKDPLLAATQRDYIAGAISEDITRRKLLPTDVVKAHDEGIIHFHDKDYYIQKIINCCVYNLEDMLQCGTVINNTLIEKPHSFSTACNIASQIMALIASGQYGGQTISLAHIAPFIDVSRKKLRKETETYLKGKVNDSIIDSIVASRLRAEIKKGVQTLQYQINTLNTSNGQTPFVSLFMYLNEAKSEQEKNDLALFIEEVLNQRIQGVKNEKGIWVTPSFPKLLYVLEEDNIKPNSKYYWLTELAAECSAKRMVPDYISEKIMLENKGDVYPCMGCRSFLTKDRWSEKYGNISNSSTFDKYKGHIYYGRFNQGVVTLNLPDIALSAKGDLNIFWQLFEERTELCHKALRCRHDRLLGTMSNVSPIHWQYGGLARLKKDEPIDKLLYHGYSTLSLGYAGLWECVLALTGHKLIEPEGKTLGLQIMHALNNKCEQWKQKEDIDYSVYGTPLESATYRFATCLKKRFPKEWEKISGKNYVTNSYHINVTEPIDAFSKLKFESEFQKLSPGGCISYVEVPNMQNNIPAVLELIKFIYNNIMYAELNTKSDYCMNCGYDGEIMVVEDEKTHKLIWECPNCKNRDQNKMQVVRRTCGYLGSHYWNQGRTEEIRDRVVHVD